MRRALRGMNAWVGSTWQAVGAYLQIATGCALIALMVHTWTLAADVSRQDRETRAAAAASCEYRQTFGPHLAAFFAREDAFPPPILDAYRDSIPDECP